MKFVERKTKHVSKTHFNFIDCYNISLLVKKLKTKDLVHLHQYIRFQPLTYSFSTGLRGTLMQLLLNWIDIFHWCEGNFLLNNYYFNILMIKYGVSPTMCVESYFYLPTSICLFIVNALEIRLLNAWVSRNGLFVKLI